MYLLNVQYTSLRSMRFCASFSPHTYYLSHCLFLFMLIFMLLLLSHTKCFNRKLIQQLGTCYFIQINNIRFGISFYLFFLGRKRPIIKSPSLNIEHSDVTDHPNHIHNVNDQQLLNNIEHQIINDESKYLTFFYGVYREI